MRKREVNILKSVGWVLSERTHFENAIFVSAINFNIKKFVTRLCYKKVVGHNFCNGLPFQIEIFETENYPK